MLFEALLHTLNSPFDVQTLNPVSSGKVSYNSVGVKPGTSECFHLLRWLFLLFPPRFPYIALAQLLSSLIAFCRSSN